MSTENMRIWDALKKTDPDHTKKFQRAGGFRGTAVKPIHMTEKMTRQFGPCGKGWGMCAPSFEVVTAGDEIAVYCTVGLWWESKDNFVYGVGGDFVAKRNKNGLFADDEAFKKAFTDALGNAMKHLGMAADVHMGQHDDDKYVTALRREIEAENGNGKAPAPQKASEPSDWETLYYDLLRGAEREQSVEAVNAYWDMQGADLARLKQHAPDLYRTLVQRVKQHRANLAQKPAA